MSQNIPPHDTLERLAREAEQAFARGDYRAAGGLLDQALGLAPGHAGILHSRALAAYRSGDLQAAERFALESIRGGPTKRTLLLLGEICVRAGHDEKASEYYALVLRAAPANVIANTEMGGVKDRLGDKAGARACYKAAVDAEPNNPELVRRYAEFIWNDDPGTAVEMVGKNLEAVGGDLDTRAYILSMYVSQVEQWERMKRGLMPYHVTRLDELFFHFARPQLDDLENTHLARLAAKPGSPSAKLGLAYVRFVRDDRHAAEKYFREFPEKIEGKILDTARFSPAFHEELRRMPDSELTQGLPPCVNVTEPVPDPAGVLYLSCDGRYLDFALPMICSAQANAPETPIHLHVMDASPELIRTAVAVTRKLAPLRVAISAENPGLDAGHLQKARNYYHAVRFIRLYEHAKIYRCPLWLADVDAVVNRSPRPLFSTMQGHDTAMRVRPGRIEPWNQFNASIVGFAPTGPGLKYLRQIAAYLARHFRDGKLQWGIDQLAMYAVWADLRDLGAAPSIKLLDDRSVDYHMTAEGFFWCNSGVKKFWHLRQLQAGGDTSSAGFGENKYVPVFERFWRAYQSLRADGGGPNQQSKEV